MSTTRRDFLRTASTCAVIGAVVKPSLLAAQSATRSRLGLGFAPMNELERVIGASEIGSADGAFISRGARVSLTGVSGSSDPAEWRAVELVIYYSYLDGARRNETPFRAWGRSRTTGAQASPITFELPVDQRQELAFGVTLERGRPVSSLLNRRALVSSPVSTEEVAVSLTTTSRAASMKLVRGRYIIVPLFDNEADPVWSRFELKMTEGRWALHDRRGDPAAFEHFVLSVDYATA